MRHIILFIAIATLLSCGQNDTKQKELELKERELALKEKEFALKQNDSLNTKAATTTPAITPTVDNKANVHSDFKTFWADFKKAVNDGDKDAVASMTVIPFKDKYTDELSKELQGMGKTRTSNSVDEFKNNFKRIFTPEIIKHINSNNCIGWESRNNLGNASSELKKGDYFLQYGPEGFLISKRNGIYKLISIPYFDMTFDAL